VLLSPTRSKAYQHEFSRFGYFSPRIQRWNALVSEAARKCQHYFDSFPATAHVTTGRREATPQRDAAACTRSGAKSVRTDHPSLVAARDNVCFSKDCYGLGGGVGRGLGVGPNLGVGVGLGVGVAVAVPVAVAVAVAVAVGLAVTVTVAVGVGVGLVAPQGVALDTGVGETLGVGPGVPTAAAISIRPQP